MLISGRCSNVKCIKKGGKQLYIKVIYQNDEVGLVEACELDDLILSRKIKKFMRSEGWATIGIDPTRREPRHECSRSTDKSTSAKPEGSERRK
jgi:hypothetical protein